MTTQFQTGDVALSGTALHAGYGRPARFFLGANLGRDLARRSSEPPSAAYPRFLSRLMIVAAEFGIMVETVGARPGAPGVRPFSEFVRAIEHAVEPLIDEPVLERAVRARATDPLRSGWSHGFSESRESDRRRVAPVTARSEQNVR